MRIRWIHFLIVVVVLACCRIVHDSMLTSSRAADESETRHTRVVFFATTRPTSAPTTQMAEWVEEFLAAPRTIDAAPKSPTTQSTEQVQIALWRIRSPEILLFDRDVDPTTTHNPKAFPAPAIDLGDGHTSIASLDALSGGNVIASGTPRGDSSVGIEFSDRTVSAPPAISIASGPDSLNRNSLPPAQSLPAPGGVDRTPVPDPIGSTPAPVPEPQIVSAFVILAAIPALRSWRRFGRAL